MSGEMKIALIQRKQSGGCKEKPKRKNGDDSNIFLLKKTVFITVKSTSLESASENCVSNDTGLHTNSQKTHVISSWSSFGQLLNRFLILSRPLSSISSALALVSPLGLLLTPPVLLLLPPIQNPLLQLEGNFKAQG